MGFFRHSERTPKQKIKIKINHESPLFTLIKGDKQVKLKTPEKLRQVKELVTESLGMLNKKSFNWEDLDDESEKKLENLIHDQEVVSKVLKDYNFLGIDRKAQIKPCVEKDENGNKVTKEAIFILKWGGLLTENGKNIAYSLGTKFNDL